MSILIAGIGYIGAKLLQDCLEAGEEVVAIDNFFSTDPSVVRALTAHRNCRFVEGSFGNRRVLAQAFAGHHVETVYALAAQSSPYGGAAPARYTEATNLLAPRQLLDAMLRYGVRSIIFASSLKVYGEASAPRVDDDAPYGTILDLSHLSKCYVEKLLEMYAALHGLRCLSARLGIVYGLSPVMKADYRFMTAPNKFCRQLSLGEQPQLYPGSQRPAGFIHVADASAALRGIASHPGFDGYHAVNAATEWATVSDLAAITHVLAGRRGLGSGIGAVPATTLGAGERLASTGFRCRTSLAEGLGEVLDYFISRSGGASAEAGAGVQ